MKIYTTFLDSELKEIFESKPTHGIELFKKKIHEKMKRRESEDKKRVKFLSQYL